MQFSLWLAWSMKTRYNFEGNERMSKVSSWERERAREWENERPVAGRNVDLVYWFPHHMKFIHAQPLSNRNSRYSFFYMAVITKSQHRNSIQFMLYIDVCNVSMCNIIDLAVIHITWTNDSMSSGVVICTIMYDKILTGSLSRKPGACVSCFDVDNENPFNWITCKLLRSSVRPPVSVALTLPFASYFRCT